MIDLKKREKVMTNRDKEEICCVALHFVKQGYIFFRERPVRHDLLVLEALRHFNKAEVSKSTQGFLTSKGRFIDRKEAARIAFMAGQIPEPANRLISEDLW